MSRHLALADLLLLTDPATWVWCETWGSGLRSVYGFAVSRSNPNESYQLRISRTGEPLRDSNGPFPNQMRHVQGYLDDGTWRVWEGPIPDALRPIRVEEIEEPAWQGGPIP
jgi:hypothetical protein